LIDPTRKYVKNESIGLYSPEEIGIPHLWLSNLTTAWQ